MVTDYKTNCGYYIGKLENVLYLIDESNLKNIKIDNGEAYINSMSGNPLSMAVSSIALTESDELDERYAFNHSLSFTLDGYANHNDFYGKYYAIVKSANNEYWLLNPMMPCKVTYTYTLDSEASRTEFTMSIVSNFPILRVNGMDEATPYSCNYALCKFKSLKINEKAYSFLSDANVMYTNDGFKDIAFNRNSATFTEVFDGNNVQHSLTFRIRFSEYKSSWHYNLLEFTNNKYAVVIGTSCGGYILSGFHFGLQPSFTVTANGDMSIDIIEIILSDIHDNGELASFVNDVSIEGEYERHWVYTQKYDGYECVGFNLARYLLMEEVDALGNPRDKYKCLEGYEDTFAFLGEKLVGTFENTEEFYTSECGDMECYIDTSLEDDIVMKQETCWKYSLRCGSDWSITTSSNVSATPSSGEADVKYDVIVCNSAAFQTDDEYLTLLYCDTSHTYNISVTSGDTCLPMGNNYTIGAEGGYLTIPIRCCAKEVRSGILVVRGVTIRESEIVILMSKNDTNSARTLNYTVVFCDGSTEDITITQPKRYERWVFEGNVCNGGQQCELYRKYSGLTPSEVDTPTNITKYENCTDSSVCGIELYRWSDTSERYCGGGKKFVVQVEQVSTDSGTTWSDTINKRLGDESSDSPSECSDTAVTYEYQWVITTATTCIGFDSYYLYKKQRRIVGTSDWQDTLPIETSYDANGSEEPSLAESGSTACGYEPPIEPQYKWVLQPPSDFICDECDVMQYRWYTDYTECDGTDLYAIQVKQQSEDGETWETIIPLEQQTVIQEYDSDRCE